MPLINIVKENEHSYDPVYINTASITAIVQTDIGIDIYGPRTYVQPERHISLDVLLNRVQESGMRLLALPQRIVSDDHIEEKTLRFINPHAVTFITVAPQYGGCAIMAGVKGLNRVKSEFMTTKEAEDFIDGVKAANGAFMEFDKTDVQVSGQQPGKLYIYPDQVTVMEEKEQKLVTYINGCGQLAITAGVDANPEHATLDLRRVAHKIALANQAMVEVSGRNFLYFRPDDMAQLKMQGSKLQVDFRKFSPHCNGHSAVVNFANRDACHDARIDLTKAVASGSRVGAYRSA